MDTFFYILLLLNFGFGVLAVVFLFTVRTEPIDPGVRSLAFPFVPLTLITALQIIDYYLWNRYEGRSLQVVSILYDLNIVSIAFFWNYIVLRHYELNGVTSRCPGRLAAIGGITIILAVLVVVGHVLIRAYIPVIHGAIMAFLFYAGGRGILITRKTQELFPSSRTAVTIAALSLIVYPLIAIGDLLGWRLPFLDPRISFWAQAHPLYVTGVSIPIAYYISRNRRRVSAVPASPGAGRILSEIPQSHAVSDTIAQRLTPRENQIVLLLYEGYRYREIAEQLSVSLATVRTHVHHIYEKLEVSRKEELFIALRGGAVTMMSRFP